MMEKVMMEKVGGQLLEFHFLRGEYEIVVIGKAGSFENIAAVKMLVAASGVIQNLTILEMIDLNTISNKAAAIAGSYRAPGQ